MTSVRNKTAILVAVGIAVAAVLGLYLIFQSAQPDPGETAATGGSGYNHVEGDPGAGEQAPDFTLSSSTGGEISLSDFRGQSVLLYFQEGLMCQPCWDQITDLEANQDQVRAAGVDHIISITHDPIELVTRKAADEGFRTPVLSDPDQNVIHAYDAHKYGMMRGTTAGHSFVLVGPDGTIQWRADYGGAPDYTMFLPTGSILADLAKERTS